MWRAEVSALVDGEVGRWMFARPGAADPPSPRWLYDGFRRSAKTAGVEVGRDAGFVFHDLRHWAGSVALRDGHDPVTVAARLGHSPDTLLRVYAQEIADGQAGVASSIVARLAQPKGRRAGATGGQNTGPIGSPAGLGSSAREPGRRRHIVLVNRSTDSTFSSGQFTRAVATPFPP